MLHPTSSLSLIQPLYAGYFAHSWQRCRKDVLSDRAPWHCITSPDLTGRSCPGLHRIWWQIQWQGINPAVPERGTALQLAVPWLRGKAPTPKMPIFNSMPFRLFWPIFITATRQRRRLKWGSSFMHLCVYPDTCNDDRMKLVSGSRFHSDPWACF